jgi:hypothetical protein
MASKDSQFYVPGLMDLSAYHVEAAPLDSKWDEFVEQSPQGTVFSQSSFYQALNCEFDFWHCFKNNELKGAVGVPVSQDREHAVHSGLLVYNGIVLAPPDKLQNASQSGAEDFRITCALLKHLTEQYKSISFATHPALADMRPFTWFNYGESGPHFELSLRYTSLLDIGQDPSIPLDETSLYKQVNKSRRQEIRYGRKNSVETQRSSDLNGFMSLYEKTFARQDLSVPQSELASIRGALENLQNTGQLRLFETRAPGNDVGAMAAFAIDSKRAYFAFAASDPEARAQQVGTMVLWDSFDLLRQEGVHEVDLEGINSPSRGYFKLSFGGSITPYYLVRYGES